MTNILNLAVLYFFVSRLILCLALGIGIKSDKGREKTSPFECGFDPFKRSRVPFSIRFFLVTVIFLVFDVEVALLLPLGLLKTNADLLFVALSGLILITVLVLGLFHE
jgi:NADH-ubiquinone oxidoreductase chain 3